MAIQRILLTVILTVIALGMVGGGPSPRTVRLRLAFHPGQKFVYRVKLRGKIHVFSEVGVAMETKLKGALTLEQVVESVARDGTATLVITLRGTLQTEAEGGAHPEMPKEQNQPTYKIPPTKLRVKLAPDGMLRHFRPLQEPQGEEGASPIPFLQDPFQAFVTAPAGLSLVLLPLPPKPLKIGETWTLQTTFLFPLPDGTMVPVRLKVQGKLVGTEKKRGRECAVMVMRWELSDSNLIKAITKALPLKEMGIGVKAEGSVRVTEAKVWRDLRNGWLIRSEVKTHSRLNVTIQSQTNVGPETMQIQSSSEVQFITDLVNLEGGKGRND